MDGLDQTARIAIGLIISAGALAVLHVIGGAVRNGLLMQELTARTSRLRTQYRRRLSEASAEEVLIVDEAPDEPGRLPRPAPPAA